MNKMPNMISSKDLLYITDMFNWNIIAAKKLELYLDEIQDEKCSKMIDKLCSMHYQICADLADLLEEGGK